MSVLAIGCGGCHTSGPVGGSTTPSPRSAMASRTKGATRVIPSSTPRPPSQKLRIALIASAQDPLLPALRNGAAQAAHQMGSVQVMPLLSASTAPAPQAGLLQQAQAQQVDGILLLPSAFLSSGPATASATAGRAQIQAAVDRATKAQIRVMTLGNDLPGSRRVSYCGSDEIALGEAAGREITELLGKKGRLAILLGRPGDTAMQMRLQGARQALRGAPEVRLTGVFYCDNNPQRAVQIMRALSLAQQHQAQQTKEQQPGGSKAVSIKQGSFKPDGWLVLGNWPLLAGPAPGKVIPLSMKMVALDPSPATWPWIQSKRVQVCLGPKPFTWGEEGLKLLVKAIDGQKLPARVDVGFERVTPDTLETYKESYRALWQEPHLSHKQTAKVVVKSNGQVQRAKS